MKSFLLNIPVLLLIPALLQGQNIKYRPIEGVESKSLVFNGMTRTYDIFFPANIKDTVPLVVMLHGGGGNSKEAAYSTQWVAKARKEKFAVVFPNGTRPDTSKPASFGKNGQTWNDGSTRSLSATENNIDDIGFIRSLIENLCKTYPIDKKRIYVTGFSNGASMAFRLGIECSDIFAAIAPVSGSLWVENTVLKNPVSLLYITGDSDPLNPYNGGEVKIGQRSYGTKKPVGDIIMQWVNMLAAKKDTSYYEGDIYTQQYKSGNAEIVWLTVKGMGHHWPGGNSTLPKRMVGNPSNALNGTDVIWAFFSIHSKE
jgi:polyhydroxybutyrate depolymerase